VWQVEYTDEFDGWYQTLGEEEQDAVIARVELLQSSGPGLGRPVVGSVHQSRHSNMKELRSDRALRVLFAFDPRRAAILLVGGDKSPDDPSTPAWNAWYEHFVPIADKLYDVHLGELRDGGLI
jgi:hypothetical protein